MLSYPRVAKAVGGEPNRLSQGPVLNPSYPRVADGEAGVPVNVNTPLIPGPRLSPDPAGTGQLSPIFQQDPPGTGGLSPISRHGQQDPPGTGGLSPISRQGENQGPPGTGGTLANFSGSPLKLSRVRH